EAAMLTRRDVLGTVTAAAASAALPGCSSTSAAPGTTPALAPERRFLARLGEGLPEEQDYAAEVEGRLPERLAGTLYRNGPGLFARGGVKKWNLLDGDGLIRATSFSDGRARFRSRFVRTLKYEAEEKTGTFVYPTWTTPAPGTFTNIPSQSQAGI